MSNKYGLALKAPIRQTILPAMNESGIIYGWYPITATNFAGTERTFTLTDGPQTVVPITTVTTDSGKGVPQYMAAVWPKGIAANYQPWASTLLMAPDAGYYRWWSMPSEAWLLHHGLGTLLTALEGKMDLTVPAASTQAPPTASNGTLRWQASVKYDQLSGMCPFFDFNWITLFAATSTGIDPVQIVVTGNPAPIAPSTVSPMKAVVVGAPQAVAGGGVVYNTVRIMKLADEVPAGSYTFNFNITDTKGQSTAVTLTLTVV